MTGPEPLSHDSDPLRDARWLLTASCVAVAGSVAVLLITQSTTWRWPLLAWGVAIGILGFLVVEVAAKVLLSMPEATDAARATWRRRRVVCAGLWIFFGLLSGTVSAGLDLLWVDLAVTAYAVLSVAAGVSTSSRRIAEKKGTAPHRSPDNSCRPPMPPCALPARL